MFSTLRLGVAALAVGTLLLVGSSAWADRVKLKDGRVIEGTVIPQGTGYWVRATDGQTHRFTKEQVVSVEKGSAAAPGAGGVTPGTVGGTARPTVPVNFNATKAQCNTVESALAAVTLWQQFLDNAPANSPDLPAAREEFKRWKALADGGAEKIKGKWVGGEERKQILAKATKLQKEADDLIKQNQTLQAVKKLEEAAGVYPNSYETTFTLAYIAMIGNNEQKAQQWLAKALQIRPNAPEVLGNQGLLMCAKGRFEQGIPLMYKALQKGDRKEIVHNLITAIAGAPPAIRRRKDVKEAEEAARLLAGKYKLSGPGQSYIIVPPARGSGGGGRGGPQHEAMWSGTGFVIAADGLILTNRHVVEGAKTLMVVVLGAGPGGKDLQKSGEVVVIDEQQDLALVRIKPDPGQAFRVVQLAPLDSPADGAECTVLGYPMIDRLGAAIKITRGVVSSGAKQAEGPDVMIDAKVNPGNSGGPIFDRFGNVMAIVSMKTIGSDLEDTYGLGISAGNIRKFLGKNNVKVTSGRTGGTTLSAEELAARAKPSTVCILATK